MSRTKSEAGPAGPTVIEVRNLHKRFRMPAHRPDTFKERAVHPFRNPGHRELKVLDGISFDVKQGEFFGVVGGNGTGKSTLLKLLANIYRANGGTIRVAGRVASVIELGVGFQPELAARENVVLNCMMMGMTAKEGAKHFDAVIEFAELQDFVDLKLKNYSSGMRVRLAFATMLQSDPDILLLDEVLAVGDAPFQRKCQEVFRELRAKEHKTIVLVTHQLPTVATYCSRVMVLEAGKIARIGAPEVLAEGGGAMLTFGRGDASPAGPGGVPTEASAPAKVTEVRIEAEEGTGDGGPNGNYLKPAEQIRLRVFAETREEIARPGLRIQIRDESNTRVFSPPAIELTDTGRFSPGVPLTIEANIENRLAPGRYFAFCALTDHSGGAPTSVSDPARVQFVVGHPGIPTQGLVTLEHHVRVAHRDEIMDPPPPRS
jgi:ABC-type polysaccharide/polyol phosphate transport system ATPase subunit